MADEHPKPAGVGVNSVPTEAKTYFDIAIEDQRRALAEASMGRWAAEAKPPLAPGEVPHLPQNSPFAAGDGLGAVGTVDVNLADPSGTLKNRGID